MRIFTDTQAVGFCWHFKIDPESADGCLLRELVGSAVADVIDGAPLQGAAYRAVNAKADNKTNQRMYFYGRLQKYLKPVFYSEQPSVAWLRAREFWGLDRVKPTAFGVLQAIVETIVCVGRESGKC